MADNIGTVTCASEDGPASCPALTSADDRRVNESRENKKPDFSKLIPALWVTIFSYLSQRERLILSLTCHALYDICMQSSVLWRTAFIHMGNGKIYKEIKLNPVDKSVLRALSHHTKSVTIRMNCICHLRFEKSSYEHMCKAATQWPLEHLEVEAVNTGRHILDPCFLMNKSARDWLYTCFTLKNASGLCSLKICAHDSTARIRKPCIVEALRNSSFTSSLTNLYFGLAISCSELSEIIGRFENLQYLTVPSDMLSDDLLTNFPKHLREIHFIANVWGRLNEVSNWPHVLTHFPHLIVGLEFDGIVTLPDIRTSLFPISSVKIQFSADKYYIIQWKLLQVLPKFCSCLKVLQCKYMLQQSVLPSQCSNFQSTPLVVDILIKAVSQCPELDHLEFYLCISSHAIITLARMRKWRKLEFDAASISFGDSTRTEGLQTLCAQVSSILGRDWKPRSVNTAFTDNLPTGIGLQFPTISPP